MNSDNWAVAIETVDGKISRYSLYLPVHQPFLSDIVFNRFTLAEFSIPNPLFHCMYVYTYYIGRTWAHGDHQVDFSIQSCSKPLMYTMVTEEIGHQEVPNHINLSINQSLNPSLSISSSISNIPFVSLPISVHMDILI